MTFRPGARVLDLQAARLRRAGSQPAWTKGVSSISGLIRDKVRRDHEAEVPPAMRTPTNSKDTVKAPKKRPHCLRFVGRCEDALCCIFASVLRGLRYGANRDTR
jgi:hypothetical protein